VGKIDVATSERRKKGMNASADLKFHKMYTIAERDTVLVLNKVCRRNKVEDERVLMTRGDNRTDTLTREN